MEVGLYVNSLKFSPVARASQNEWLYSVTKESSPREKTHRGTFMMVEKDAMEKKMQAAVAMVMYPAYKTTGKEKRMLATIQQQNAVLQSS